MKKYLILILIFVGHSCFADDANEEIKRLEQELHEARLQEMKAEITSENYMKYEWGKYTEEIERAEKLDQKIKELQKKIDALRKNEVH